jgi:hypothetical protein
MDWEDDFEHALAAPDPLEALSGKVRALVDAGADRDEVYARLHAFHVRLQDADRDAESEVTFDGLDFLTGWCAPHRRI